MSIDPALYSSADSTWCTPASLLHWAENTFNDGQPFDLDPAASGPGDSCGLVHYTPAINGLVQPWFGAVYLNPPYGRGVVGPWLEKVVREVNNNAAVSSVTALLPSRTDQKWFRDYIVGKAAVVVFLIGRVQFVGGLHGAPFPSLVVHWVPESRARVVNTVMECQDTPK